MGDPYPAGAGGVDITICIKGPAFKNGRIKACNSRNNNNKQCLSNGISSSTRCTHRIRFRDVLHISPVGRWDLQGMPRGIPEHTDKVWSSYLRLSAAPDIISPTSLTGTVARLREPLRACRASRRGEQVSPIERAPCQCHAVVPLPTYRPVSCSGRFEAVIPLTNSQPLVFVLPRDAHTA